MIARVTVGGVDPWVLTCSLGQSLLEPLVECAGHVVKEFLVGLLQLLELGVLGD